MDLSKVKLKPTKTIDKSAPKITGYDAEELRKFQQNIRQLFMEEWYQPLKEYTYKTTTISISKKEAQFLTKQHEKFVKTGESNPKPEEIQTIELLLKKVEIGIKEFNDEAFLKMSSRSPKDVMNEKFDSLVKEELSKKTKNDDNEKCFAILRAACLLLKVKSRQEVIDLLIKSERIYSDFQEELQREEFKISLILREWVDIHPDMEFRGFCFNGKFTALSQYNYTVFFPHVVKKKNIIQQRIKEFFDEIQPKLMNICEGCLIIDFHVLTNVEEIEDGRDCVKFIELNTFDIGSEASMFSWKNDLKQLKEGPFEFRVLEKQLDNVKSVIPKEFQKYL
eukprot:gene6833-10998_t